METKWKKNRSKMESQIGRKTKSNKLSYNKNKIGKKHGEVLEKRLNDMNI